MTVEQKYQARVFPTVITSSLYGSYEEAGQALDKAIGDAIKEGNFAVEYGGLVVSDGTHYYTTNVVTSDLKDGIVWSTSQLEEINSNYRIEALEHSHPQGAEKNAQSGYPSADDRQSYGQFKAASPGFRGVYIRHKGHLRRVYRGGESENGEKCLDYTC